MRVVPVTVDALVVEHQTTGTVKPYMQSQVAGQVGGVVARIVRRAGDWVEKDDTVIQLDDSQLQLSLKTAQASLETARINLSTGQDTTKQANPRLDLQVRSAQSTLSAAQRNYDSKKALFDLGGATKRRRRPGEERPRHRPRRTWKLRKRRSTRTRNPTFRTSPS